MWILLGVAVKILVIFWALAVATAATAGPRGNRVSAPEVLDEVGQEPLPKKRKRKKRGPQRRTTITADVHPISTMLLPSAGITFESGLNSRHHLGLSYAQGFVSLHNAMRYTKTPTSLNVPSQLSVVEPMLQKTYRDLQRFEFYHSEIDAHLRSFWTRSFNTKIGLGVREMGIEYPVHEISTLEDTFVALNVRKTGVKLGMGNQWRLGWFVIGFDWVEALVPLQASFSKPAVDATIAERFNHYANVPTLSLLNFSLGATF